MNHCYHTTVRNDPTLVTRLSLQNTNAVCTIQNRSQVDETSPIKPNMRNHLCIRYESRTIARRHERGHRLATTTSIQPLPHVHAHALIRISPDDYRKPQYSITTTDIAINNT